MIRCHKCGYFNLHNASTCIKCRTNLIDKEEVSVPEEQTNQTDINRKTIIMPGSQETPWDQESAPAAPAAPRARPAGGFQTVRRVVPDPNTSCLVAISLDEEKDLRKIDLRTEKVTLDRNLLDPANNSISRSGHATMYQKDGNWYLENRSSLKTTFIRVNKAVKLTDGDVILMGDSLFQFRAGVTDKKTNEQ